MSKKKYIPEGSYIQNCIFQNYTITLTFQPITILSLFVLFVSGLFAWENYSREKLCSIVQGDYDINGIQWIELVDKSNHSLTYLDNGAFVLKHIFMKDFKKEFNVDPIHFPEVVPEVEKLLENHDLETLLHNEGTKIDQNVLYGIYKDTEKYKPQISKIEEEIKNGTYVDDERVYARWVNDVVRYGMFASRDIKEGELLGIYCGVYSLVRVDLDYAWEYNYLVNVTNTDGEVTRVTIDGKHKGNYLRFANHRDDNHNGESIYIIYNNRWLIIYIARDNIKAHEQIFVNYGPDYWGTKDKATI
ncbi:hypothetical protein G9A89_007366 [Geosiphon pyriformis]|nr:hypothetical protein G9A89_007366 [Geosiphon pyriformis]